MHSLFEKMLDSAGLEVQRRSTLHHFLQTRSIDLVVDAGANLGFFAKAVRRKGYRGRIWSFEPISGLYDELSRKMAGDTLWQGTRCALGASAGTAIINIAKNHCLSSLLKPTALGQQFLGEGEIRHEDVPVDTLDHVLRNDRSKSIFVKMDVQGFEREVLAGASKVLERTCALHVEVPVEPLYEGSWRFRDAIEYIDELGFVPAQFRTVNPLPDDPASAVEFDCLFRRKEPLSKR